MVWSVCGRVRKFVTVTERAKEFSYCTYVYFMRVF